MVGLRFISGVLVGTIGTAVVLQWGARRLPWITAEFSTPAGTWRMKGLYVDQPDEDPGPIPAEPS